MFFFICTNIIFIFEYMVFFFSWSVLGTGHSHQLSIIARILEDWGGLFDKFTSKGVIAQSSMILVIQKVIGVIQSRSTDSSTGDLFLWKHFICLIINFKEGSSTTIVQCNITAAVMPLFQKRMHVGCQRSGRSIL